MIRHKRIGYDLKVMRQSAFLVVNPITVDNFVVLLISRRLIGRDTLLWPPPKATHFSWLVPNFFVCCLVHRGSTDHLLLLQISSGVV